LAWLLATAHHLPPAELAGAVAEALARVGAVSARLFLADPMRRRHRLGSTEQLRVGRLPWK
jgi:hypothetical protein